MSKIRFARRVEAIEVSAIKQMPIFASKINNVVSLGQGIPSVPTPKYIRRHIIELLESEADIGKYSLQPGYPKLKQAVAQRVSKIAGRPVDAEKEIFISTGAMEALFTAITSLLEEGDDVLLFDPSYASHIEQVKFAGAKPVFVSLNEKEAWAIDQDKLNRSITKKTKAIVICNPGNPTGKVFLEDELRFIVNLAIENDLFVIADETYDFLLYDSARHISLTSFPELKDRLAACFSFSKEFAMTGWRVGYMYAPSEVIEQTLKVHDAAVICAPSISQYAALVALTCRQEDTEESVRDILVRRREVILSRLDALGDLFSYIKPMGAYYILPRYLKTQLSSDEFSKKILHEAKVITIPGRAFGPSAEGHIRMSFGADENEINEAFDRLEKWNKNL